MKNGFTLIELMIVVVIIGILAGIAYPTYVSHLYRARRSDGQAALLDLASRMESYYSIHNTYATATLGSNPQTDVLETNISPEQWYTLSITSQSSSQYALKATPRNAQAEDKCQSLTLDSIGNKGVADGATANPSECW